MKYYYENLIKESKAKQELMELGLRALLSKKGENISLDCLKLYLDILQHEKDDQANYEERLNDFVANESNKETKK